MLSFSVSVHLARSQFLRIRLLARLLYTSACVRASDRSTALVSGRSCHTPTSLYSRFFGSSLIACRSSYALQQVDFVCWRKTKRRFPARIKLVYTSTRASCHVHVCIVTYFATRSHSSCPILFSCGWVPLPRLVYLYFTAKPFSQYWSEGGRGGRGYDV